jgi:hypothetical protein
MKVAPGDRISASVVVAGRVVQFALQNRTRGSRYATRVVTNGNLDTASAEWVAEAPSLCRSVNVCQVVPLSNFGLVTFSEVSAAAGKHAGALADPLWKVQRIALLTSTSSNRYVAETNPFGAVPGPLPAGGTTFQVAYRPHLAGAVPAGPLPGAPLPSWIH